MPTPTDINKELQKRIDRYIRKTLKNIKVEAADEFDANFNRQAFFNEKLAMLRIFIRNGLCSLMMQASQYSVVFTPFLMT